MVETLRIADKAELDIVKTFDCGQCFRWNQDENGVYSGVAYKKAAKIWEKDGGVFLHCEKPRDLADLYFDLKRDYSQAETGFSRWPYLAECADYGRGIRILRQEPWEALCSFIISQCNNIPRIKHIVETLCDCFGQVVELDGTEFRGFPAPADIAKLDIDDLAPLRCGYRAEYILNAARAVAEGELDLNALIHSDSESALKALMSLKGVGSKVANCVVLFGLYHMEAFPIDVWIRRSLKENFPPEFDPAELGDWAGLAQQYIFYYARSTGTSKDTN